MSILANIDINTLLAGSTGFAVATILHQWIRVRYDVPEQRAREERREENYAAIAKQIGELVHITNTLVIQNSHATDAKIDTLRDLIQKKHEPEENSHR